MSVLTLKNEEKTDFNQVIRHFQEINQDIERAANESFSAAKNLKPETVNVRKIRKQVKITEADAKKDDEETDHGHHQRKNDLIVALNKQLKSVNAEYEATRKKCALLQAEKSKCTEENARLHEQLKRMKKQLTDKQEALNLEKTRARETAEKLSAAEQMRIQWENENGSLQRENQTLKEEKSRLEHKLNRLMTQMAKNRPGVNSCPADKAALMLKCIAKQRELISALSQHIAAPLDEKEDEDG